MGSDPALSTLVTRERHREIPLRDVRDLALAVIEGAVAAEALANELRRAPDRSRHFRDIAERLRAVVSRPSIRDALIDDRPNAPVTVTAPSHPGGTPGAPSPPVDLSRAAEPSSGARQLPAATLSEVVDAMSRALGGGELARRLERLDELAGRLAQREGRAADDVDHDACTQEILRRLERIEATLGGAAPRAAPRAAERVLVRHADDALAVASRLVAQLANEGEGRTIVVEIVEPDASGTP